MRTETNDKLIQRLQAQENADEAGRGPIGLLFLYPGIGAVVLIWVIVHWLQHAH